MARNKMITILDVEKYWDQSPCNIKHSRKKVGSKKFFDEVEKKKFFVEPHIIKFSEFSKWKGKNVLEIGCGLGTAGINFARHGANYTGFELSGKSLDLAKKRFEIYGQKGEFYLGNAEELSDIVPIEIYDLIYSFGVIHHSPKPKKIINEIKKYMSYGSTLKLMLYATNSWKNMMIQAGLDRPEAQKGCPIAKTYDEAEIRKLLEEYVIIDIDKDHIFPYRVGPYKSGKYEKQPWFSNMPKEIFNILEKNLGWHYLVTAKIKK
tara:strand:+ start:712 stop:1500 length:789 start_codon:yes stop_codon:yes gene_type:complete